MFFRLRLLWHAWKAIREVCSGVRCVLKRKMGKQMLKQGNAKSVDFDIYAEGFLGDTCSVCSRFCVGETTKRMNQYKGGKWRVADCKFPRGQANPLSCDKHPETHTHYLYEQISDGRDYSKKG